MGTLRVSDVVLVVALWPGSDVLIADTCSNARKRQRKVESKNQRMRDRRERKEDVRRQL